MVFSGKTSAESLDTQEMATWPFQGIQQGVSARLLGERCVGITGMINFHMTPAKYCLCGFGVHDRIETD